MSSYGWQCRKTKWHRNNWIKDPTLKVLRKVKQVKQVKQVKKKVEKRRRTRRRRRSRRMRKWTDKIPSIEIRISLHVKLVETRRATCIDNIPRVTVMQLVIGLSWAAHGSANVKTPPRRSEVQPPPVDSILRYHNFQLHSLLLCHHPLHYRFTGTTATRIKCWQCDYLNSDFQRRRRSFTFQSLGSDEEMNNQMESIRININRSDSGYLAVDNHCIFSSSLFLYFRRAFLHLSFLSSFYYFRSNESRARTPFNDYWRTNMEGKTQHDEKRQRRSMNIFLSFFLSFSLSLSLTIFLLSLLSFSFRMNSNVVNIDL